MRRYAVKRITAAERKLQNQREVLERQADKLLAMAETGKPTQSSRKVVRLTARPDRVSWPIYVTEGRPGGGLKVHVFRNRGEADAAGFGWAGKG